MKLIKINSEHFIIVSDEEVREGDDCICFNDLGQVQYNTQHQYLKGSIFKNIKKVTHTTAAINPLFKSNLKKIWLSNVKDLLGEKETELLVPFPGEGVKLKDGGQIGAWMKGWEEGYKECCQLLQGKDQKKYTEEEIKEAYWGREGVVLDPDGYWVDDPETDFHKLVSKLRQAKKPTEWEVEFDEQGKLKLL